MPELTSFGACDRCIESVCTCLIPVESPFDQFARGRNLPLLEIAAMDALTERQQQSMRREHNQ